MTEQGPPPTPALEADAPRAGSDLVPAEPKPDALAALAVDANELARAVWSGRGLDVSRLVVDLLKDRAA